MTTFMAYIVACDCAN